MLYTYYSYNIIYIFNWFVSCGMILAVGNTEYAINYGMHRLVSGIAQCRLGLCIVGCLDRSTYILYIYRRVHSLGSELPSLWAIEKSICLFLKVALHYCGVCGYCAERVLSGPNGIQKQKNKKGTPEPRTSPGFVRRCCDPLSLLTFSCRLLPVLLDESWAHYFFGGRLRDISNQAHSSLHFFV